MQPDNTERNKQIAYMWNNGISSGAISTCLKISRMAAFAWIRDMRYQGVSLRGSGNTVNPRPNSRKRTPPKPRDYFQSLCLLVPKKVSKRPLPPLDTGISHKGRTLDELEPCDCRWPLWGEDDDVKHYCGQRKAELSGSYCPYHEVRSRR